MTLNTRVSQLLWLWEIVKCLTANVRNEGAIVRAQFVHHLRDSCDVIVARADEAYQCFPSILLQYSHSCEFWRLLSEIGVRGRPLLVQLAQVEIEIEIVLDQVEGIILVRCGTGRRRWRCEERGMSPRLGECCAIMKTFGILSKREHSPV